MVPQFTLPAVFTTQFGANHFLHIHLAEQTEKSLFYVRTFSKALVQSFRILAFVDKHTVQIINAFSQFVQFRRQKSYESNHDLELSSLLIGLSLKVMQYVRNVVGGETGTTNETLITSEKETLFCRDSVCFSNSK